MTDAAPARRRLWPVALISLVAGLLAAFVLLQVLRPKPPEPQAPPTGSETVAAPAPDRETEAATKLLDEARDAFNAGRLEEAREKLALSRRVKDLPEAADLDQRIAEVAASRTQEEQQKRQARLAEVRAAVEKLRDENRWDAAAAALEAAQDLAGEPDFDRLRQQVLDYRAEADKSYRAGLEEAKAALKARRYALARDKAQLAVRLYPERPEAQEFLLSVEREMQTANMIRIPAPPKGHAVRLGDPAQRDEGVREYAGPGFVIDKCEVTNEEYQVFVDATGHRPPRSKFWVERKVRPGYGQYPVIGVSASDAEAYASWAGKRLPTEDEWEYAARYIDGRAFPWGPSFVEQETVYLCNSVEYGKTAHGFEARPVGSFPKGASALGVMDLAGNVWEWTATSSASLRVLKGGSFMTRAEACRAANRLADDPELAHHDVGFRCVKDLPK